MDYIHVDLPSRCRPYVGIDPMTVQARTLRGREEKMIAEIQGAQQEKRFAAVLAAVLQGVDPFHLTMGDRTFLMIWLTVQTYTPKLPLVVTCVGCGGTVRHEADLSALEVVRLPEDYTEPQELELSGGSKIRVRLYRVRDEIEAVTEELEGEPNWLRRLALSVDNGKTIKERIALLEDMPGRDVALIRTFHEKFFHGPRLETAYQCGRCDHRGVVRIPMTLELFFPTRKALVGLAGASV